jgi:hypothetical protein
MTLPPGFDTLEPFVETWLCDTANARDGLRSFRPAEARQSFYDAMSPLISPALDLLDAKSLADHDAAEKRLMLLTLAYAHIATAIEVQGPDEAKHSIARQRIPISRATAD